MSNPDSTLNQRLRVVADELELAAVHAMYEHRDALAEELARMSVLVDHLRGMEYAQR